MGSTFNPQILVEKLAKLNNSQASIETLSHWCIFHMNKAKQVVETWDRQFHCSPHDQRLAYLYLANDILQNSRRKGSEFVGEFWKVLPDALRYVMDGGDELGRNAALRLIGIWEERKVFGSRGQILKEELVGRLQENNNRTGKHANAKLKHSAGNTLDKIVSAYQAVSGQIDEEIVLTKCRNAINFVEKVVKEVGSDINPGALRGSPRTEELQGQHAILRSCTEQLRAAESSRSSLVALLREAIREQEFKLDHVRKELQAAESHSEQAHQLAGHENTQPVVDSVPKEAHTSNTFIGGEKDQSVSLMYAPTTAAFTEKSAAAAMAAKLTASTSSAQMLSYVLSSLASEGVIGKESSNEFPVEKRQKLENDKFSSNEAPPPPSSSPPPLPPMPQFPAPQYMANAQYSFTVTQPPPSMPLYTPVGPSPYAPAAGSYQGFQGQDGNFYNQPSSMPMAPVSRQ